MPVQSTEVDQASPYLRFSRAEWADLRASTPLPLTEKDLSTLRGINEAISLDEVERIYLPLSRLLNLYVSAIQSLHKATDTFLGHLPAKVPYIIGIAGSVAVGKSTMARILQALLSRWPDHPKVDLVTTDGFLYPTAVLEKRGLMNRKGFPESYDQRRLVRFLTEIKSGAPEAGAPVYSHLIYDIVKGESQKVHRPDVLIVEGLNVLQTGGPRGSRIFVSDFFDFSIYIDADEQTIEHWYVSRFLKLRETVFQNPDSYFNRYSKLSQAEAVEKAHSIWREINGPNLRDNIQPTRERAQLILRKGAGHSVEEVRLRKL
jgi:type I pantothenate kinase